MKPFAVIEFRSLIGKRTVDMAYGKNLETLKDSSRSGAKLNFGRFSEEHEIWKSLETF